MDYPDKPSKTQLKKDMLALQKLGEMLIALSDLQFASIPMPENLREAIIFTRSLKSHEAIRRQLQYIGKIMREIDPLPIQTALKKIQTHREQNANQFQEIEKWRTKLIAEGDDALQEFLTTYPHADRQALRQLMRKAQHDDATHKNTGGEKELFRYLRDLMQNHEN